VLNGGVTLIIYKFQSISCSKVDKISTSVQALSQKLITSFKITASELLFFCTSFTKMQLQLRLLTIISSQAVLRFPCCFFTLYTSAAGVS